MRIFNGRVPLAFDTGSFRYLDGSLTAAVIAAAEKNGLVGDARGTDEDLGARAPDMARMLDYFDLADTLLGGLPTLQKAGRKYLPAFADETDKEYSSRLAHADYTNVYRDIIESLAAKPFEEEVDISGNKENTRTKPSEEIETICKDIDGSGSTITVFLADTFFNGINSAIDWIFVDYPNVGPNIRTMEDAKRENVRPFWSHILGRNMLEATTKLIGAKETLIRVRILEPGTPDHVRMFERTNEGKIVWGLYKRNVNTTDKTKWILVDKGMLTIDRIPAVPFATGRRDGRTFYFYPPMSDAANTALQLYGQESGLKFAKTMTAYPMLAANGFTPPLGEDGKPMRLAVGPAKVLWGPPGADGTVGNWAYVSPDAACLKFLKDDIKETMDQMRELGKQPLTAQSGNITAITSAVAAGKAASALKAWGLALANAANEALILTALWMNNTDYDPAVKVYDEYDDITADNGPKIEAVQKARDNKDLSYDNYVAEMKRYGVFRPDFNADENKVQLLSETPANNTDGNEEPNSNNNPPGNTNNG